LRSDLCEDVMPYVSAQYQPPDPMVPPEPKQVIATDEQGVKYSLTEDSQVGDWLDYLARGGTIDPYVYMPDIAVSVANAPQDLFGGPTLEEVFNGNY
jgi:hypothetical protein